MKPLRHHRPGIGVIWQAGWCFFLGLASSEAQIEGFSVRFWAGEVEVKGAVPDDESAGALLRTVFHVQPKSRIWDADLEVDDGAMPLPPMEELAGLLLELALSTKDGSLVIGRNSITVSGRTDSLVTQSALETRLDELVGPRQMAIRNEIALVSGEEYRKPPEERPKTPILDPRPLGRIRPEVSDDVYGPVNRASGTNPIDLGEGGESGISEEETVGPESRAAETSAHYGPVAPVRFDTNSFLIGFDQRGAVRETAEMIAALPPSARKVIVRGYPDAGGQSTYHEWLAKARAREVRDLLVEFGVSEKQLSVEAGTRRLRRQVEVELPD